MPSTATPAATATTTPVGSPLGQGTGARPPTTSTIPGPLSASPAVAAPTKQPTRSSGAGDGSSGGSTAEGGGDDSPMTAGTLAAVLIAVAIAVAVAVAGWRARARSIGKRGDADGMQVAMSRTANALFDNPLFCGPNSFSHSTNVLGGDQLADSSETEGRRLVDTAGPRLAGAPGTVAGLPASYCALEQPAYGGSSHGLPPLLKAIAGPASYDHLHVDRTADLYTATYSVPTEGGAVISVVATAGEGGHSSAAYQPTYASSVRSPIYDSALPRPRCGTGTESKKAPVVYSVGPAHAASGDVVYISLPPAAAAAVDGSPDGVSAASGRVDPSGLYATPSRRGGKAAAISL